jgi:hypothetical protein
MRFIVFEANAEVLASEVVGSQFVDNGQTTVCGHCNRGMPGIGYNCIIFAIIDWLLILRLGLLPEYALRGTM